MHIKSLDYLVYYEQEILAVSSFSSWRFAACWGKRQPSSIMQCSTSYYNSTKTLDISWLIKMLARWTSKAGPAGFISGDFFFHGDEGVVPTNPVTTQMVYHVQQAGPCPSIISSSVIVLWSLHWTNSWWTTLPICFRMSQSTSLLPLPPSLRYLDIQHLLWCHATLWGMRISYFTRPSFSFQMFLIPTAQDHWLDLYALAILHGMYHHCPSLHPSLSSYIFV